MKQNIIKILILFTFISSCSNWTVTEEIILRDFKRIYPDFEFISYGIVEGDNVAAYAVVKYKRPGSDFIFQEEWQYWRTKESWVIRHDYLSESLKDIFFKQLESNNYLSIDFSTISNKHWDRMVVLTPYSNPNDLVDSLNIINIGEIKNVGIEHRDDISLILFLNHGLIIDYFLCPRTIDFSSINELSGYKYNDANFFVKEMKQFTVSGDKIYRIFKN